MKRLLTVCGLAAATMLLPACATVTRGTSQKYVIESEPPQADVALSTGQKCVTPCKLKLKRKHGFTATFNKPGYAQQEAQVKSKFSGGGAAAGAGNILAGGVIGAVVDGTNGSLNNLTPNPLMVTLVPLADGQTSEATTAMDAPASAGSSETAQPNPQL
ncbi:MAG TPA: hypothetical protein VF619_01175 [Allosphingosinicella sp.]|jgi:hypothetical protein